MQKKRVLIIDFNGTSPTYTHYFALGLVSSGMDVEILGFKNPSYLNDFDTLNRYIGINIYNKHINYALNWLYLMLISRKYNVLHFQWLPLMNFTSLELFLIKSLKFLNMNVFYTIHNFFPHDCDDSRIQKRYLKLYKSIDNLVVHTNSTYNKLYEYGVVKKEKNIVLINHGYFYSEFYEVYKSNNNDINFLMLGRISPYKGYHDAFILLNRLIELGFKAKLNILGKCDDPIFFESLKEEVKFFNLDNVVQIENKFVECRELILKYNKSTFSLMPYCEIEQSGVLFTSIGLRVPVLGYDVGGLGDEIQNGKNGYLVNYGDVEELSKVVLSAIKEHALMVNYINSSVKKDLWHQNGHILKEYYFKENTK